MAEEGSILRAVTNAALCSDVSAKNALLEIKN